MCDIAAISPESQPEEHPASLLLRALRTLTPEQQDAVLLMLFDHPGTAGLASGRSEASWRALAALKGLSPLGADPQMVPVRFPAVRYEQLKAWCEQHNFPMAAVIRGLVERFLDSEGTQRP